MNTENHNTTERLASPLTATDIARSVLLARAALDYGADTLPHDITERLRASRARVLAQARVAPPVAQKTSPNPQPSLGKWLRNLGNWMRGGIAVSAFALAFFLTFGSIPAQVDMARVGTTAPVVAGVAAPSTAQTLVSSIKAAPTVVASNAKNAMSKQTTHPTTSTPELASAPAPTNAVAVNADDEYVDLILREKIPLQAYLNDDFNQFANREVVRTSTSATHTDNRPQNQ